MNVLAVEMESAALYMNAARLSKRALAMFTISDNLLNGESLSVKERQDGFGDMIKLHLKPQYYPVFKEENNGQVKYADNCIFCNGGFCSCICYNNK